MIESCFAAKTNGKCNVYTNEKCIGKCVFYKTAQQVADEREKVFARLRRLPSEQQRNIADLYYDGGQPWHPITEEASV